MAAPSNNTNQNLIILSILVVALGLWLIDKMLLPRLITARSGLEGARAQDQAVKDDIDTLNKASTQLEEAKSNLQQQGVNLQQIPKVYPTTEDMPSIYIQLESLLAGPGLSNPSYSVGNPVSAQEGGIHVPITVGVTGTYTDLKTFLVALEQNIRPITLSNLTFSQSLISDKTGKTTVAPGKLALTATGFIRAENVSSSYQLSTKTP